MNPQKAQERRSAAQHELRKLVNREVSALLKGRGPNTQIEESFVRAIYAPDRRLG